MARDEVTLKLLAEWSALKETARNKSFSIQKTGFNSIEQLCGQKNWIAQHFLFFSLERKQFYYYSSQTFWDKLKMNLLLLDQNTDNSPLLIKTKNSIFWDKLKMDLMLL